jgi:hypothetical protein
MPSLAAQQALAVDIQDREAPQVARQRSIAASRAHDGILSRLQLEISKRAGILKCHPPVTPSAELCNGLHLRLGFAGEVARERSLRLPQRISSILCERSES